MAGEKMQGVVRQKDIAEMLGLTKATVSRALTGSSLVSEATKNRVRELCEELGYHPHVGARSLHNKGTRIISIMRYSINFTELHSRWLVYLQEDAAALGYSIRLDFLKDFARVRAEGSVDGFLVFAPEPIYMHIYPGFRDALNDPFMPIVLLDCKRGIRDYGAVVMDNHSGIRMVMEHLAGLGHRNIAFFGLIESGVGQDRHSSYKSFLREKGLPCPQEYTVFDHQWAEDIDETGRIAEGLLRAVSMGATAIVASSDIYAVGAMRILRQACYRVPEEVSVTGYDNTGLSKASEPSLVTVDQGLRQSSTSAIRALVDHIEYGTTTSVSFIPASLVIRGSAVPVAH